MINCKQTAEKGKQTVEKGKQTALKGIQTAEKGKQTAKTLLFGENMDFWNCVLKLTRRDSTLNSQSIFCYYSDSACTCIRYHHLAEQLLHMRLADNQSKMNPVIRGVGTYF